ncbi:DUF3788 domain-containing protein [bacterium]|nr:DUF3788 domain-containing protein [bacterium]
MAESAFDDKTIQPDDQRLAAILGDSATLWEEIKKYLKDGYGETTEEWKFYGQKSGWILKTLRKKRNLFFFTPVEGCASRSHSFLGTKPLR